MEIKREVVTPKKGMNRDTSPNELGPEEYTFALNANIHDENGNGRVVIQNESSNVKCSGFKAGYKVVGHKYDINSDETYFFLHNPTTTFSEIGVISSIQNALVLSPTEQTTNGDITVVLETPLENTIQTGNCEYTTLITDMCNVVGPQNGLRCLNFSLDAPFHTNNIHIKYGKRGKTLWFNHFRNPQRYVQLDNLSIYTESIDPCDDIVTKVCLDCDKMRVFPLFEKPCLYPNTIKNGGNLRAGVMEVLIAASDVRGKELTDYYAITNPIRIFDKNNTILDQTNLDYLTNQAVEIDVIWSDDNFEYYKIAVIYRSGLDSAVTVYNHGIYPAQQSSITIYTLKDKEVMSSGIVTQRRPMYTAAKGAAVSNGYLLHYGLKTQREINLQPVVNLMGAFARWVTYQAHEDLYEDGVNSANYLSAMRDEVYPYSIKFIMAGGFETANFPFIARPPSADEIEVLGSIAFPTNPETNSVLKYNKECQGNDRNRRWQFENTATELGACSVEGFNIDTVEIERVIEQGCYAADINGVITIVDTIISSSFVLSEGEDIVSYINTHTTQIIASTGSNGADIRGILEDPTDYLQSCTPVFADSCAEPIILVSEEIFAIDVALQTATDEPKPLNEYTPSTPPETTAESPFTSCVMYTVDGSNIIQNDTTFVTNYMVAGEVVKQRNLPSNEACTSPIIPTVFTSPQLNSNNFMRNKGEVTTVTSLRGTRNVSTTRTHIKIILTGTTPGSTANINLNGVNYAATFTTNIITTANNFVTAHAAAILAATGLTVIALPTGLKLEGPFANFYTAVVTTTFGNLAGTYETTTFSNKLHTNAIWYKLDFSGQDLKIFEVGTTSCQNPDDNTGTKLRVTLYTSCAATSDQASYGVIIENMTITDVAKFLQLNSADFGGITGTAYIVLDSPIRTRRVAANTVNTLTPPCDCFPVFQRQVDIVHRITYTNLTFGKKQVWSTTCTYSVPKLNGCTAVPYKNGLFSYWESTELYPCNKELYDSSELIINETDIPAGLTSEFTSYFSLVGADINGNYVLNAETDYRDNPIRHYKYPDNNIAPFMSADIGAEINNPGPLNKSVVYPMGFRISNEVINTFLDVAVNNGLISAKERVQINSYEIYRGDRRIQKSVVAKGLLFDVYNYEDGVEKVYYPNYPLNTLGVDSFNGDVQHPYSGSTRNEFFTFHSPDTSLYKPTLPREMRVEGYQFGNAINQFDEVLDHPTYVLLGNTSYALASTLAIVEVVFEVFIQASDWIILAGTGGISTPIAVVSAVLAIAGLVAGATFKAGEYRYKWLETITNLGRPINFAYYQVCIGFYNVFKPNNITNQILRGLTIASYMKPGMWELTNEDDFTTYNVNNLDRESSVAIHTGAYPVVYRPDYVGYDNATTLPSQSSRTNYPEKGRSAKYIDRAASPYVALKQYNPSQYGELSSISWINTGYCGNLIGDAECDAAFGGDTFISRFSLKRKLPFFRTNSFGLAPLTPYKYSDYFNINPENFGNRFYIDYEINDDSSNYVGAFIFPSNRSKFNLDNGGNNIGGFYIKPPNKFYLFSYGIPHFLVESVINCNYRYGKREAFENFYPNLNDVVDWTQEKNVSIKQPNTFFYNTVYSAEHSFYPTRMLPINYSRALSDKLNDLSDTIVYSGQDVSENSSADPWLQYKALDTYTFSKMYGDLVVVSGIESLQLLIQSTNGFAILGSIDQIRDKLTMETANLGNGGIFAGRPVNFNTTDLGHAGTQHNAKVSCEFGHFWVDAKRGKVFQLDPGGQGMEEISKSKGIPNSSLEKWFKEQLPFKLTNFFPDYPVDNAYNGAGITMGWDDRLKRVLITKKDYIVIDHALQYNTALGFYIAGVPKPTFVTIGDPAYFEECSWTVGYSPLIGTWISYYSYLPNYYVNYNDFFQTGINTTTSKSKFGLWSHLPFLSSYQVFYGELFPFIIEYPIAFGLKTTVLNHVEYWLDVRKYYDKHNFTDVYGTGFNKAVLYNTFQNSGMLHLIHEKEDDLQQALLYPNHFSNYVEVLQTEMTGRWTFNYLYNIIKNEKAGLPIWLEDCTQVMKTIDDRLLDYEYKYKDRMRGAYFLCRLINDKESRYKMLFQFGVDERTSYIQ